MYLRGQCRPSKKGYSVPKDVLYFFVNVIHEKSKEGLDRRHPCCVPVEERMVSPPKVMSFGSILYSHQVRFVKSGHPFEDSDIIKS